MTGASSSSSSSTKGAFYPQVGPVLPRGPASTGPTRSWRQLRISLDRTRAGGSLPPTFSSVPLCFPDPEPASLAGYGPLPLQRRGLLLLQQSVLHQILQVTRARSHAISCTHAVCLANAAPPRHQGLPPGPRGGPAHHPLQHRRLRQRLHPPPPAGRAGLVGAALEGFGPRQPGQTQVLRRPELGLGPLPSAPHPPLPVPLRGGELPPFSLHGALLLPPVPPPSFALHGLLVTYAS